MGVVPPFLTKVLARSPRTPWGNVPAVPPKPEQYDNEESYDGKVLGSAGKGHGGIF